jgi:hypothetical protein
MLVQFLIEFFGAGENPSSLVRMGSRHGFDMWTPQPSSPGLDRPELGIASEVKKSGE